MLTSINLTVISPRLGRLLEPADTGSPTRLSCHNGSFPVGCVGAVRSRWVLTAALAAATLCGAGVAAGRADEPAAAASEAPDSSATRAAPLRVGRVTVVREDIFTPEELADGAGPLQWLRRGMNTLHTTTGEGVVRRELLLRPGDPLAEEALRESERNLRDLGFLTDVAVVAVDTLPDGAVDIEARVRETWSLRTQLAYARDASGQNRWSLVAADKNFAGRGVEVTAGAGGDQDRDFRLLGYSSRRLAGRPYRVLLQIADQSDGHSLAARVERPFYAQADAWGVQLWGWDQSFLPRYYLSNAGPAGLDPSRPASLYAQLRRADSGARLIWLRRAAGAERGRLARLGGGLEIRRVVYDLPGEGLALSDGRRADAGFLADAGAPLLREEGVTALPLAAFETLGRAWTTGRYLNQYGPMEDVLLSPQLYLEGGLSLRVLGATDERARLTLRAADWSRAAGGLLLLRARGEATFGAPAQRGARGELVAGWMGGGDGPWLTRLFAEAAAGDRLDGYDALLLGLERGLRSLEFDGMAGDRLVRWNVERGLVLPGEALGFYKLGLAVFYAGGAAWWRDEARGLRDARHEAGAGLRIGSIRSARVETVRLDLTWPLAGGGPELTAVTGGLF